ncbi:hypothetical protein PG997_008847 [Apiospora hydei]|uniref:Uncharacterized protein n=1 Tax=Apiospora hydei TaxID=1337664 RepID=A0ABR1WBZ8_9PEZI
MTPWPDRSSTKKYQGNRKDLPEDEEVSMAPLLWVSALLSERFWSTEVSKHGAKALFMPKLVKTTRHYSTNGIRPNAIYRAETLLRIETPLDSLRDRLRTTALDFNARTLKWADRHPWYDEERYKWLNSPWRWADNWRWFIKQFKTAHAKKDEFQCYKYCEDMMGLYNRGTSWTWMYWAIGLLMKASMPVHRTERKQSPMNPNVTEPIRRTANTKNPFFVETLVRSQVAQGNPARHQGMHKRERSNYFQDNPVTIPPSEYTEPDAGAAKQRIRHQADWLKCYQSWSYAHERLDPLPRGWHDSLAETERQLEQARRDPAHADRRSWAPFDFKVPPYDDRWQAGDLVPGGGAMVRTIIDADAPALKPLAQLMETRGEELRKRLDEQAKVFLAKNVAGEPLPHLTVTEVGGHREADDAWVIYGQNNNTYNVYDVTAALKELKWTTQQYQEVTRTTDYGLEMRTGAHVQNVTAGNAFLRTFMRWKLLGKLMVPMLPEAVKENDGTGGMSLYKTCGKHVFDLTSFLCPPHWREILLSNPGGPINESLPGFYPEMISVISKHRCGYVMDPPTVPRPDADLTPFTERTLRVYDNPRSGLYYAVEGFVYDMTSTYIFSKLV